MADTTAVSQFGWHGMASGPSAAKVESVEQIYDGAVLTNWDVEQYVLSVPDIYTYI